MKQLTIAICLLILSSCQTQKKWQKKGYEKGWLKDSVITKYDTIKGFELDSIYLFDTLHHTDTLFTYQNGLKVTTIVKWKERQVKQTITQRDTIFTHKYTTKVIKEPKKWLDKFWIIFLCGFFSSMILLSIIIIVLGKPNLKAY